MYLTRALFIEVRPYSISVEIQNQIKVLAFITAIYVEMLNSQVAK
jgi:hypothetical protein